MATTDSPSTVDNTKIFQQLEAYQWEKDAEFQGGLSAILGPATDASQIQELTLRAQVFYLSRKKSIPIDFDAYKAYLSAKFPQGNAPTLPLDANSTLASNPKSFSTSIEPEAEELSSSPDHQILQASTMHLPSISPSVTDVTPPKPSDAPYPQTFAEIVHLITTGAPIPGIKDIPPTVLPEKATKPVAKKRRKPWETDVPDEVIEGKSEGTFGDQRDTVVLQELPE